jgi:hypothetical protein
MSFPTFTPGQFVRVCDGANANPGKDGMVISDEGDSVALVFGYDRHNYPAV